AFNLSHGRDLQADEREGAENKKVSNQPAAFYALRIGSWSPSPNGKAQPYSIRTWLETVSSMDDLLELLYPDYSLVHHCLQQALQGAPPSSSLKKAPSVALLCRIPRHDTVRLQGGFLRPVSLICDKHPQNNDVIFHPLHPCLPEIMTELQRTACHPREECVEVAKEHPESTSSFFRPRCISVHRCGGCCNHEGQECVSTRQNLVQKTVRTPLTHAIAQARPRCQMACLLQISPLEQNPSIITLTFVNHTSCDCQPKESLHTIRRRAITAYFSQCSPPDVPCSPDMVWDPTYCKCVSKNSSPLSAKELELLDAALLALCGPSKVLNREQCKCMCQNGLTEASCGPGQVLNDTSCQCACKQQPDPGVCPPNQTWDPERCGCVCRTDCPADQPRDPGTCQCQCRDGPQTCRLQRKMFRQETCSCYRPPFRISPKPSQLPQPAARQPQTRTSNREGWWLSRNH
ncbi:hypothetical protein Z043_103535, partial [Scleropages formosus]